MTPSLAKSVTRLDLYGNRLSELMNSMYFFHIFAKCTIFYIDK